MEGEEGGSWGRDQRASRWRPSTSVWRWIGEQLGSMDRLDLADGFDLDDDPPLDEQVEPVGG
jgi:hypothetical protein